MNSFPKITEQQKNRRAGRITNGILKQTHDMQTTETIKFVTGTLTQILKKPDSEDGKTQTPSIQNATGTYLLRDILTIMRRSRGFFSNY